MHPPPSTSASAFRTGRTVRLELHCCRGQSVLPVRLLLCDRGDRSFAAVLGQAAVPAMPEAPCPGLSLRWPPRVHHGAPRLGDRVSARALTRGPDLPRVLLG